MNTFTNFTRATVGAVVLSITMIGAVAAQFVNGEVTKVDKAQGKITLRHDPIKNLSMDGMTMVFRVQDQKMLDTVKVGDKVKFEADRVNGELTVTKMQK
jgi:Cu/Ag efflux protein CusF